MKCSDQCPDGELNHYEHTKTELQAQWKILGGKKLNGMRFNLDKSIITCSWESNSYLSHNKKNYFKRTVK